MHVMGFTLGISPIRGKRVQVKVKIRMGLSLNLRNMLAVSSIRLEIDWVLDSGYSLHMIHFFNWFNDLKEVNSGSILLGDDH